MPRIEFQNGEYARWIKRYQLVNPETISFSNDIDKLNEQRVKITHLNPLEVECGDADMNDIINLGRLGEFFDYVSDESGTEGNTVTIRVGDSTYLLENVDNCGVVRVILTAYREDVDMIFQA